MDKETLAGLLNGREYGDEITKEEAGKAAMEGLVVVFGYSDDNMEFEGAIDDEVSCYDGGDAFVTTDGLLVNECDCDDCPYFRQVQKNAKKITAVWDTDGYSWIYKTNIPHATFEIFEGEDKYCRGIVFSLSELD